MKLLVGLGNPWTQYAFTRHNAGFLMLDRWVSYHGGSFLYKNNWWAEIAEIILDGQKVVCIKPMLYMNRSGLPVQQTVNFYKLEVADILVIHDEIDLDFSKIQVKVWGGSAGHNWLKDIIAHLGTPDFVRLRIGVGHPGSKDAVSGYVLGNFSQEESDLLTEQSEKIIDTIDAFVYGTY